MTVQEIIEHCSEKPGTTLEYPFDNVTMVFKAFGKIYAIVSEDQHPISINLKCDPEIARELRAKYDTIIPGFHMNKKHWNTILCDGALDKKFIYSQIDNSYNLIFNSLPKKIREATL